MVILLAIPSCPLNFTNLSRHRDLVRMFVVWSSVGTYYNTTNPSSTYCRMKWQWISMCFVRSWKIGFLASFSTPWLSQNKREGPTWDIFMSESIQQSQTTSHAALTVPWYFASVKERASACCFLLVHVTAPMPRLKTYLEVDFLSSIELSQSESVKPISWGSLLLLYRMPKLGVLFTYLSTRFAATKCCTLGVCY